MQCPKCRNKVGNSSFCPWCGTPMAKRLLFSAAWAGLCAATVCTLLWYAACAVLFSVTIGQQMVKGFHHAFLTVIFAGIFLCFLTVLVLAFRNRITFLPEKFRNAIITLFFSAVFFLILACVGNSIKLIRNTPELISGFQASKAGLNLFAGFGMSLLAGSVFTVCAGKKKAKGLRNALLLSALSLVLSVGAVVFAVCVLAFGFHSIFFAVIGPLAAFAISFAMK